MANDQGKVNGILHTLYNSAAQRVAESRAANRPGVTKAAINYMRGVKAAQLLYARHFADNKILASNVELARAAGIDVSNQRWKSQWDKVRGPMQRAIRQAGYDHTNKPGVGYAICSVVGDGKEYQKSLKRAFGHINSAQRRLEKHSEDELRALPRDAAIALACQQTLIGVFLQNKTMLERQMQAANDALPALPGRGEEEDSMRDVTTPARASGDEDVFADIESALTEADPDDEEDPPPFDEMAH